MLNILRAIFRRPPCRSFKFCEAESLRLDAVQRDLKQAQRELVRERAARIRADRERQAADASAWKCNDEIKRYQAINATLFRERDEAVADRDQIAEAAEGMGGALAEAKRHAECWQIAYDAAILVAEHARECAACHDEKKCEQLLSLLPGALGTRNWLVQKAVVAAPEVATDGR